MDTMCIMSVDPGTNTGISFMTVNLPELDIVHIETYNINLELFDKNYGNNRVQRLHKLHVYITDLVRLFTPTVLAVEGAFLNSKFPKAVMYLSQYIATIENAVYGFNPEISLFKYPPRFIKSRIGATGSADKDKMLETIISVSEINDLLGDQFLTEHQVDSIAIGYTFLLELRNNTALLLVM